MKHSEALRRKIGLCRPPLHAALKTLWAHPRLPELVPLFFVRLHTIIRASVPLMQAARARARALAAHDEVAAELAGYLEKHIPEERHHDDWLLADLEMLGLARAEVLARLPSPVVAECVGAQYYWIHHHHPVALLGYIGVIEGDPPRVEDIEEIARRSGLPREGFKTYIKHAHLDPHHKDDLDRFLDRLPLTPEHQALIGVSAIRTLHLLARAVADLVKEPDPRASRRPGG